MLDANELSSLDRSFPQDQDFEAINYVALSMGVSILDSALEYLASWSITELRIFLAGVTMTLLLSILIQKHELLWIWLHRALASVVGTIWKDRKTNAKVVDGDAEGHEGPDTTETSITRKPFRFRERLWHEPPEFGYEQYECFAEVQKDIKQTGRNVEQKTHWLDIQIEQQLLDSYHGWARSQRQNRFYKGLHHELRIDLDTVSAESEAKFDDKDDYIQDVRASIDRAREKEDFLTGRWFYSWEKGGIVWWRSYRGRPKIGDTVRKL